MVLSRSVFHAGSILVADGRFERVGAIEVQVDVGGEGGREGGVGVEGVRWSVRLG